METILVHSHQWTGHPMDVLRPPIVPAKARFPQENERVHGWVGVMF